MKHQKTEIVQSILPPDRISNIPDNVAETILMRLPTRDAVRTSILSTKWRHVWTRLPQFMLDTAFWKNVVEEHSVRFTLMKVLIPLLTHCDGPITKFTLIHPLLKSCPEIDNLIHLLSRRNLEDFTFRLSRDGYLLPNSFFSCQRLRYLGLGSCSIKSFPAFKGFCMLKTLKLHNVTIDAETLSSLISGSPLLVHLELLAISCSAIYIDGPNLRTFTFCGITKSIMFQRVPVLASVIIFLHNKFVLNIGQFFQPLLSLESLNLSFIIPMNYEFTIEEGLPTTTMLHLTNLKISYINFNEVDDVLYTFWLLRRSLNLKLIQIQFNNYSDSNSEKTTIYMEGDDFSDIWFSKLMEVKFVCYWDEA